MIRSREILREFNPEAEGLEPKLTSIACLSVAVCGLMRLGFSFFKKDEVCLSINVGSSLSNRKGRARRLNSLKLFISLGINRSGPCETRKNSAARSRFSICYHIRIFLYHFLFLPLSLCNILLSSFLVSSRCQHCKTSPNKRRKFKFIQQ